EQYVVVRQPVRNFNGADIGKGNTRIFRLATGIASQQMRIAKQPGRRMPHQLFSNPGIRIGVFTQGEKVLLTKKTSPAGNGKGGDDAVAHVQFLISLPVSTTSPINSWPRMSPCFIIGMNPL